LGTLILSPNQEYSDYLYRLFVSQGDLEVYKVINEYPPLHQLVRLLNAYQPDLIFLEMGKDHKKVLILEADLHSGLLPVLVKLNPKYSIVDALGLSDSLDERAWEQLVTKAQGLDLLPTPIAKTKAQFSPWDYHRLLAFASHRYDFVVVDLPEVVNDATEAIVTRASRVHIVCTSEDSSLFLARRRIFELEARMVRDERLRVVLNRHQSDEPVEEVEELIGRKLAWTLPNDYTSVKAASTEGRRLDPNCPLGRSYRLFAAELAGIEQAPEGEEQTAAKRSSEDGSSLVTTMLEKLRSKVDKVRGEDTVKPPAR
jgi:Flp pilus assembly CpaE family ATPase